ncbi:hypothetical protein G4B88_019309 [Cannabis sativa]|uniref:PDZ domain-containing protein n=1 Tax=Cannabis sativa TaxID=3483 RepID=A0A7J6DLW3_CANSA|nr:hypothetical protein G4B88_019309 [Cannabis sativa]
MGDHLQSLGSEAEGLESNVKDELCMDIDPPFSENSATADDWRKALSKVVPAVVVLRTTACRAFDTEAAGASYATGFVVDKLRGIILTNRHVVKSGPVVAEAMFVNREEIPVYPIYRDPVHDFGFFRYDPAAIQFHVYEEIPLAPESACVGLEIRVVGNDSGEKVSILAGTLARLDRDAPHYKNGSPVIDWQGRAVALNAGSKSSSASAFFLPLERVVRALKFLQNSRDLSCNKWEAVSIPRGTLQVTFLHKGFDETRRLGLQSETEQMVRHASPPGETGMLVVDSVVPGGPAYNCLEPGDVLVRMNGKVSHFVTLIGIELLTEVHVQDLHSITPDYFLEVSGAVIHPLSYQQARNFRFNCGLVYVTEPGYMLFRAGVPRHAIIKKFAGEEISQLEELISILSKLSRGARVPLEYVSYTDRHRRKIPQSIAVTIDAVDWIIETVKEVQQKEERRRVSFKRSFRNSSSCYLVEYFLNTKGSFLKISVLKNNMMKTVIIPEEEKANGWSEFLRCLNSTMKREQAIDNENRAQQKADTSNGKVLNQRSWANVVKEPWKPITNQNSRRRDRSGVFSGERQLEYSGNRRYQSLLQEMEGGSKKRGTLAIMKKSKKRGLKSREGCQVARRKKLPVR